MALLTGVMCSACDDDGQAAKDSGTDSFVTLTEVSTSPTPGQVLLNCDRVRPRDGVLTWMRYEYGPDRGTVRFGLSGVGSTEPIRATVSVLIEQERQIQVKVVQSATGTGATATTDGGEYVRLEPSAITRTKNELSIELDPASTGAVSDARVFQMWGTLATEGRTAFCEGPAIVEVDPSDEP